MPVDPRILAALNAPLKGPRAAFKSSGRKPVSGYPTPPGTGPAGETCGSCAHILRRQYAKTYIKCARTETHGAATDIRVGSPACSCWEARV